MFNKKETKEETDKIIAQVINKHRINNNTEYKLPSGKYHKYLTKKEDLDDFTKNKHYVCLNNTSPKTNVHYLWITKYNGLNSTYLISFDKKEVTKCFYHFSQRLYDNDYLLEGQVSHNIFIIYDIINHKYFNNNNTFYRRYHMIKGILNTEYFEDKVLEYLELKHAEFFEYKYIKSYIDQHNNEINQNSSLMFYPNESSFKIGVYFLNSYNKLYNQYIDDNKLYNNLKNIECKILPRDISYRNSTKTFWLEQYNMDNYKLYSINNNEIYQHDTCVISNINLSKRISGNFDMNSDNFIKGKTYAYINNMLPYYCKFNWKFRKWEPIEINKDYLL